MRRRPVAVNRASPLPVDVPCSRVVLRRQLLRTVSAFVIQTVRATARGAVGMTEWVCSDTAFSSLSFVVFDNTKREVGRPFFLPKNEESSAVGTPVSAAQSLHRRAVEIRKVRYCKRNGLLTCRTVPGPRHVRRCVRRFSSPGVCEQINGENTKLQTRLRPHYPNENVIIPKVVIQALMSFVVASVMVRGRHGAEQAEVARTVLASMILR